MELGEAAVLESRKTARGEEGRRATRAIAARARSVCGGREVASGLGRWRSSTVGRDLELGEGGGGSPNQW